MKYSVQITETALGLIREQARYIAVDRQAPLNAARWLERVLDAADALAEMPRRFALAQENDFAEYEVRRVPVDGCVLLFTIDESARTVWVIGFRHGRQLPREESIPNAPPTTGLRD